MSKINILSRKFLLKLAQDPEAQTLLKKHLGDVKDDYVFKKLVQRDIIPIISARPKDPDVPETKEQTAFLGKGLYSKVYEVSYKGKLAVAKVTETESDYDIMLALDALKSKLGADARHLPVIYDHFKIPGEIVGFNEQMPDKYVIVVEKLEPLNSHLVSMMFPTKSRKDKDQKFNIAKNIDLIEVAEKINKFVKDNYYGLDIPSQEFLPLIDSAFRKSLLSANSSRDFDNKFRNELSAIDSKFKNGEITNILKMLRNNIGYMIGHLVEFPYFSYENSSTTSEYFKNLPEAKDFYEFLLRLRSEFGISWGDTHYNNIMIRPSTGDLVLSDSGYFKGVV